MNSKLIKQYGINILCYRLRTTRHKRRMQYEDFDKQLICLYREKRQLHQKQKSLGWEPLVPPVQKGWKRQFVLREDVARSSQAHFFDNILKKINTMAWSHRRNFQVRKRKCGRKFYVVKEQQLLQPNHAQFAKLNFTDAEKKMFHEALHWNRWQKKYATRFVFNEPWRFVLKVKPNIISRIRKTDAELESRLKQIDNYLERNEHHGRLTKILHGGGGGKWRHGGKGEQNILRNKPLAQVLDDIKE